MSDTDKVSYVQDRCRWVDLHSDAMGNFKIAIKKLKRIDFSDESITDLLKTLLEEDMKMRRGE